MAGDNLMANNDKDDKDLTILGLYHDSNKRISAPENYIVQKSRPLLELWWSQLSLESNKLLDIYLSRINSHDPSRREVIFEKKEVEKLLDVKQIKPDVLNHHLHLLFKPVEIEEIPDISNDTSSSQGSSSKKSKSKKEKKKRVTMSLFEYAEAPQDDYDQWVVKIKCTESAMKYFFNIDTVGYIRYKLKNIIHLRSSYSYHLYIYLKDNIFRGSWTVDLSELKKWLYYSDTERYSFKVFNRDVLKKAIAEICDKTDIRFEYTPVKKGRSVVGIKFTQIKATQSTEAPETSVVSKQNSSPDDACNDTTYPVWASALIPEKFSADDLDLIYKHLVQVPLYSLAVDKSSPSEEELDIYRERYLSTKYALLIDADRKKTVKNRCKYLCKILDKDAKSGAAMERNASNTATPPGKPVSKNKFNDFDN